MEIRSEPGHFILRDDTVIVPEAELKAKAKQLAGYLEAATGYDLQITTGENRKNAIKLVTDKSLRWLGDEGYQITVRPDEIRIAGYKTNGIFYGIQTLRQLMPLQIFRQGKVKDVQWAVPCVGIKDKPRFCWRGLMIDCSRTFWNKEFIKRYIDLLSVYKMNVLHLHLTDDQGWRIEIKSRPKLTELCSTFAPKYNEPAEREGYYSQDDIRELVAYALDRNITIVPEIEMPGHSSEVFAAYPELSCRGVESEIYPYFKGPGITSDILCAGNEETFVFLEDVLAEVIELFGSQYIHIGGDEAPKERWKSCPRCQRRIREEGLKNEDELQSWFVQRIEKYLNSKGKKLIGWDEILEGGLAANAAVMSWRGMKGGIAAAKDEHFVVMSPTSHCYFDYTYGRIPTEKVYSFEPVPAVLPNEQHKFILGAQANFWSHIDRTEAKFDRQIFPRYVALSEVVWSPRGHRDWEDFRRRLKVAKKQLKLLGVYCYDEIGSGQ